jgi:S1-C subfamily serine protease
MQGEVADGRSVFTLVTMDRVSWTPYEYGSAFFFGASGDAYTASHVVATAVRLPSTMLVAVVGGREYAARVVCWNPASGDAARTFTRDVAVIHVGPEVPVFPVGVYRPAAGPLAAPPLRLRRNPAPQRGEAARVVGFGLAAGVVWESNIAFAPREAAGRVVQTLRAPDGAKVVTVRVTGGMPPADGGSGGPILDGAGNVIGLADWLEPSGAGRVDLRGIAAASLGCVTRIPPGQQTLSPSDTPIRRP